MLIDGKEIGVFGTIHPTVAARYGLSGEVLAAELQMDALLAAIDPEKLYHPLPKFPASTRDIAVLVDDAVPAASMQATVEKAAGKLLESVKLFDVYKGKGIPEARSPWRIRCPCARPTVPSPTRSATRQCVPLSRRLRPSSALSCAVKFPKSTKRADTKVSALLLIRIMSFPVVVLPVIVIIILCPFDDFVACRRRVLRLDTGFGRGQRDIERQNAGVLGVVGHAQFAVLHTAGDVSTVLVVFQLSERLSSVPENEPSAVFSV